MDNRCPRFENCKNNACKNKIVTYNCNPANKEYWNSSCNQTRMKTPFIIML